MSSRTSALVLALAALSASASAQLDLPRKRSRVGSSGPVVAPPAVPRGDLAPSPEGEHPRLDLSPGQAGPPPPSAPAASAAAPTGGEPTPDDAARFVFDQLARIRDPDASLASSGVESLAALGPAGIAAARRALLREDPVGVVVAARLLLRHGQPEDRRAVADRLLKRLPAGTAGALLTELLARDPVLASPELLCSLLDHPDAAMRVAAHRALAERVDPALLAFLARPLAEGRTAARLLALDLVGRLEDPVARQMLASRLDDRSARVAARAAELFATVDDDGVVEMLRDVAFGSPIDRRGAYALLSLIEREERTRVPVLGDEDVPALLVGLRSPEPIVAGASAAALAGIGFRSSAPGERDWLDRDVPHTLVRTSSGAVFHPDFTSLQRPAQRRLQLLSGESFGRDGLAWQRWWGENAEGFRARRAVLIVRPGDASALLVRYAPDRWAEPNADWLLVGPAARVDEGAARVVYLSDAEAGSLAASLAELFGADRQPGLFGSDLGPGRRLTVDVRDQHKRFEVATGAQAPWFDRAERAVLELARANRWQRWFPPDAYDSQHAFWEAQRPFLSSDAPPLERSHRLKRLLFDSLDALRPADRDEELDELVRLYAEIGVPEADDFPRLLSLLEAEPGYGSRARELVALALVAAATTGERPRPAGATVDPARGRELLALLSGRFGEPARSDAARCVAACGRAVAREVARDASAFLRSVCAEVLAEEASEEDVTLLLILLRDSDETVQAAAARAVGRHGVRAAQAELAVRADEGPSAVRAASLVALARLGDGSVHDLCLLALAEDDEQLQIAAIEALAEVGDSQSASVLATMFARGPDSRLFAPARAGLERLGAQALPQLRRLAQSPSRGTRREAAILLSRRGVADAASLLLTLFTEDPTDDAVASELAVLSGVDLRAAEDPVLAGWAWWDGVVHDDSLAWLRAAAERQGIAAPEGSALAGAGTAEGARFLVRLARAAPPHVGERARRELERLLGEPVGAAPTSESEGRTWEEELAARIEARYRG